MSHQSTSTDGSREPRLKAILAEYRKRKDAGQAIDPESLMKAYPDLADSLRSYFEKESLRENPALAATKVVQPSLASVRETVRPGAKQSDTASEFSVRMFGRYQLLRPLGEGAMGSVYLAQDTTLDRRVALKMPKKTASDQVEFLARFTREARAAAGLKHLHICQVFDAGEIDGTAYITMDFIDGVTLSQLIGSAQLQSVGGVLQMVRMIADAVGHAHANGVIHRDLKPGNILVDNDLKPYVTDFGLARRESSSDGSRLTQEGLLIGTPAYMAPEQVRGEQAKVGVSSDIYSLGVILFEMLTTRIPFDGSVPDMLAKVLRDNPPVPSRLRKDLTEDVDDLVLKMLKKDPSQRYASISEVVAAIDKLTEKLSKSATVAAAATTTERARSPFEIQKAHVELMLKKGQYATAIQELEKLSAEKSPGARAVAEWARNKLPGARAEAKALSPAGLAAMLKTAQQLFEKSDYQGCMQLLEDVPALKRTEPMEDLRRKAQQRETDAEQLLEMIKEKERRQDPEGLEQLVKKFLKLKPGSAYGKRLSQALQTYSTLPSSRRYYRFEKGRLQPMPEPSLFARWSVLALLVGVLTFLSMSYYVIIYLKSGSQTLAVHVDDEWLKSQGGVLTLVVDGNNHTITAPSSAANGQALSIVVTLGEHTFSVKHGDSVVHDPKNFEIQKDGRSILQITSSDMRLTTAPEMNQARLNAGKDGDDSSARTTAKAETPAPAPANPWIPLFDGSDTGRWSTLGPFKVKDGLLVAVDGKARAISRDEYGNFELEADWRINQGANGGIYYRELDSTVGAGNEYQLIDPSHPGIRDASQQTGSLYGILAPDIKAGNPVGGWNTTRIVCRGPEVEHWLNDRLLFRYDTTSQKWKDDLAASSLKQGKDRIGTARRGHILLQSQSGELAFRSIRIRELRSKSETSSAPAGGSTRSDLDRIATGVWKPLVDSSTPLTDPAKMKFQDGVLELDGTSLRFPELQIRDVIVRAEVRKLAGLNVGITVRHAPGKEWTQAYAAWFNGTQSDGGDLFGIAKARGTSISLAEGRSGHQFGPDQFVDMAVSAIGNEISLYVEGRKVHSAIDAEYGAGTIVLGVFRTGKGLFRNVRYQSLDPSLAEAPFGEATAIDLQNAWARHIGEAVETTNSVGMKLRLIPAGEFTMGSPETEPFRRPPEGPQHRVRLTQPYYLGATEVTQAQWVAVMGSRPWQGQPNVKEGDEYPASYVNWHEAIEFCRKLSAQEGENYRLPAEAEWEFACRAGTTSAWYFGDDVLQLEQYAWFDSNTKNVQVYSAQAVGKKKPNPFGLFDMHGNVFEWCQDVVPAGAEYPQRLGVTVDPVMNVSGDMHATRGGGWDWNGYDIRSALRGAAVAEFRSERDGFRVVRTCGNSESGGKTNAAAPTGGRPVASSDSVKAAPNVTARPAAVPFNAEAAKAFQDAWAAHLKVPVEYTNSVGIKFRLIPPGTFTIGSTPEQIEAARPHVYVDPQDPDRLKRLDSETPQQRITLSKAFYLGVTEVTQGQFAQVMGRQSPKDEDEASRPAVLMSWIETGEFCGRLTIHEKLDSAYRVTPELISQTGTGGYRLPTEAEWEFACRAGTDTQFSSGDTEESLAKVAWMGFNNEGTFRAVGQRPANPFGLFDMHGNAAEWVHDGWRPDAYQLMKDSGAVDPRSDLPVDGLRVIRGGSHFMPAVEGRSASRSAAHQDSLWGETGFRLALSVDAVRQLMLNSGAAGIP